MSAPVSFPQGTILTIYLAQNHGGWNSGDNQSNNIGKFRLAITNAPDATADPVPKDVRDILSIPSGQRTPLQVQTVFGYWRTTVPEWKAENDKIAEIWRGYPEGSAQLVLATRAELRETHILTRGDFLKPTKLVDPGVPAFLHPLPQDDSWQNGQPTRLTFARWLASRNSPTTARSIVNRVWQAYFGIGIVATSENFGTQGDLPSHPELLDWLAVQFMDQGWTRSPANAFCHARFRTGIIRWLDYSDLFEQPVGLRECPNSSFAIFESFRDHLRWFHTVENVEDLVGVAAEQRPRQHDSALRASRQRPKSIPLGRIPFQFVHLICDGVIEEVRHVAANEIDGGKASGLGSVRLPQGAVQRSPQFCGLVTVPGA